MENNIQEATPNKYSVQKQRLRETKRKQIEAIDNQSQSSNNRISYNPNIISNQNNFPKVTFFF